MRDRKIEIGQELEVHIESVGSKGDGVAKHNGLIIFVKNGNLHERYRVQVTNVLPSYAFAEIIYE